MRLIIVLAFLLASLSDMSARAAGMEQGVGDDRRVVEVTDGYTVYELPGAGGVVVETSDGQIVARTDGGDYELARQNPVFVVMLEQCEAVARAGVRKVKATMSGGAINKVRKSDFKPSVAPLLTDLWHQYYEPYNLMAPMADTVRCVSGCVASAMAQVMHFWRYPEHGFGHKEYVDSLGCGDTLTCDFQSHYYDWDNMLDDYEDVEWTDAQANAVAQLMYDCGVAVEMKFGADASGASSVMQPLALSSYFGYDCSAQMHYRDFYSIDEWTDMFKRELSAGRPVLVSGYNYRLGHAFVCDGYDERDFFHFSFGNPSGAGDGFFYLPYLTPDFPPSQTPDSPESGFNLLQSMVTNVMPSTHAEATGVENHLYAFSSIEAAGADSVVVNRLGNVGWNTHRDSVAVALKRDGAVVAFPYVYEREFLLEELDDTVYTDTVRVAVDEWVADGAYELVPMYKDNGEWIEARTSVGVPNHLIATVKDGCVELRGDSSHMAFLTLEKFSFPDRLITGCTPDFSLTLKNHNAEFCGRVYIMLENVVDSLPTVLMQEQGLTLMAGETTTRRFSQTYRTIPAGTYQLKIYYDCDLFSSDFVDLGQGDLQTVVVTDPQADDIAAVDRNEGCEGAAYTLSGLRVDGEELSRGVGIKPHEIYIKNKKKYIKR